jgi:putative dehydrogenase
MSDETIAVLGTGNMGHAVGRALRHHGHRVITALEGRSDRSRQLAELAGIEDRGDVSTLTREADIILSILPSKAAAVFAGEAASAMATGQNAPTFIDCNAVSPDSAKEIAQLFLDTEAAFVDVGIVGGPPGENSVPRFYASGPHVQRAAVLNGKGIEVKELGGDIGDASALKMCYAAMTKGTLALHTAVLVAAERLGMSVPLIAEFASSQPSVLEAMRTRVPWLATDAERWIREMEEIAATFASVGAPAGFHEGAADIYKLLSSTALAKETREHHDKSRTLDQAVSIFADAVMHHPAAE